MFVTAKIGRNYAEACVFEGESRLQGVNIYPVRENSSKVKGGSLGRNYTLDPAAREENRARADRRAAARIRFVVEECGLDLMITLTVAPDYSFSTRNEFLSEVYSFLIELDGLLKQISLMDRTQRLVFGNNVLKLRKERYEKLSKNYKVFLRRMANGNLPKGLGVAVAVPELTKAGQWHAHVALDKNIPIELIEFSWQWGFAYISKEDARVAQKGEIASYLAKYLKKQLAQMDEDKAPIESRRFVIYPRVGVPKPQRFRGSVSKPEDVVTWFEFRGFRVDRSYSFEITTSSGEVRRVWWYAFRYSVKYWEKNKAA